MKELFLIVLLAAGSLQNVNAAADKEKVKVRYTKGARIDFEALLIEGERKKPEMSVVTGNIGKKDTGLLRFRKDFNDMMAKDFGEKIR